MTDHTYKKIEIVGSSQESIQGAIENAISRTVESVSNANWFEVSEIRGHIDSGKIAHWQVAVKIGFRIDP